MARPPHSVDPRLELPARSPGPGESKGDWLNDQLRSLIARLSPGDLFPSDRVLAEQFRLARMTVRGQIDALVVEGLLERQPHRGTFVRRPGAVIGHHLHGFASEMRARGMQPSSRILELRTVDPEPEDVRALRIEPEESMVLLVRVRYADGQPMALEHVHLPERRFGRLDRELLEGRSLYELLATEFGVVAESAEQTITIAWPDPAQLDRLDLPEGSAVLRVERVTHDPMGRVLEHGISLYRADRYQVHMHVGASRDHLTPTPRG